MEGRRGYYYGAAELPAGTVWGGLGYVGYPVSVGGLSSGIFAHELGHNLNLLHAPCGGAGSPDGRFPYRDGSSGVWGYDVATGVVIDPALYKDVMGYCNPDWVSDYSFIRAMRHRIRTEDPWVFGEPEATLLLWGSAGDGAPLHLEPAFQIDAAPLMPSEASPGARAGLSPDGSADADSYRLEGLGPRGEQRFSFDFVPTPMEFGGGQFAFAVPFDPARDGSLDRVVLSGPEGEAVLRRGSAAPMAIVTDAASGQVRAIVREWPGGAAASGRRPGRRASADGPAGRGHAHHGERRASPPVDCPDRGRRSRALSPPAP